MARVVTATMGPGRWSLHAKRMRNVACRRYAEEFHNIAKKAGFPLIRAFLLGQALELYLKAFLFHKGFGETQMKKEFGHNLKRLLDEAIKQGLDKSLHISPQLVTEVEALNKVYASKALQYFSLLYLISSPTLPKLERLFRFADALKRHVAGLVK
jgi:HEPN domain-containing protein